MLNTRMTAILRELMGAKSAVTSEDLATVIQVTSRTVRNDIKELNRVISVYGGCEIKSIRGTGFFLDIYDEEGFRKFLQENFQKDFLTSNAMPTLPEDRVQYLMKRLLLAEGFLKMEDLADELYISKSTIQNDFRSVKKILESYDITLDSRPNYGFRLKGTEHKLRFCMSQYIFNLHDHNNVDEIKVSILPQENMIIIRGIIVEQIKKNNITLSDMGLHNLVVHVAIACRRIVNENFVSLGTEELTDVMEQREYEVAKQIIKELQTKLNIPFPVGEVAYIAIHLLGNRLVDYLNPHDTPLNNFIDEDIKALTIKIVKSIEEELIKGLSDDKELLIAMSLHLKPAINRFRYGMNIRNPLLNEIKATYPIAFEAGVIAGVVIRNETGVDINEHEIGYLALHIGAAMERKKINIHPKRCLIVCSSGLGSSRLLSYKLQSEFRSQVEVAGTTEYYKLKDYPLHDIDFIITTVPIKDYLPIPVIQVKTFLDDDDYNKIQRMVWGRTEKHLKYTREDLIYLQQKFESREEVLYFLSEKLQELGLVEEGFIHSVMEREGLSPTSYGNLVAIPHPASPQTDSTFWSICTLQKPILWGEMRVQFICLLSIEKHSTEDLEKMYGLLTGLVDDYNKVQKLLKCETYEEFLDTFLEQ